VSLPAPPRRTSASGPPWIVSSPASPSSVAPWAMAVRWSLPAPPRRVAGPPPAWTVSSPSPPRSSTGTVTPASTVMGALPATRAERHLGVLGQLPRQLAANRDQPTQVVVVVEGADDLLEVHPAVVVGVVEVKGEGGLHAAAAAELRDAEVNRGERLEAAVELK